MKTLLILGSALAGVLLFLLATASANTSLFARHYPVLLGLNLVLAAALAALVGYQLLVLRRRLRSLVFGARLSLRLLVLLATMAVLPGALVYTVSVQFLTRSIESWFDVRVDAALEGGINLGQSALDQMLAELNGKARAIALELGGRSSEQQVIALNRLREAKQEAVISAVGGVASERQRSQLPRSCRPSPSCARRPGRGLATSMHHRAASALRAIVPRRRVAERQARFLQLRHPVPAGFAANAEAVEAVYRPERRFPPGLKRIYIVTHAGFADGAHLGNLVAFILATLSHRLGIWRRRRRPPRGDFCSVRR